MTMRRYRRREREPRADDEWGSECWRCATPMSDEDDRCRECGAPERVLISTSERRRILQDEVRKAAKDGYRVVSQTEWSAQLVRPKRFSVVWFLIWLLLALFPVALYLVYHFGIKRDPQLLIEVDECGWISRTKAR